MMCVPCVSAPALACRRAPARVAGACSRTRTPPCAAAPAVSGERSGRWTCGCPRHVVASRWPRSRRDASVTCTLRGSSASAPDRRAYAQWTRRAQHRSRTSASTRNTRRALGRADAMTRSARVPTRLCARASPTRRGRGARAPCQRSACSSGAHHSSGGAAPPSASSSASRLRTGGSHAQSQQRNRDSQVAKILTLSALYSSPHRDYNH
mmetsp:Transcript_5551/g.14193  ORF Transcript_5551/g.14193 Transcript_5551/m.14193 type:complete len:209 (-) Transcript_5551:88-714(-)